MVLDLIELKRLKQGWIHKKQAVVLREVGFPISLPGLPAEKPPSYPGKNSPPRLRAGFLTAAAGAAEALMKKQTSQPRPSTVPPAPKSSGEEARSVKFRHPAGPLAANILPQYLYKLYGLVFHVEACNQPDTSFCVGYEMWV